MKKVLKNETFITIFIIIIYVLTNSLVSNKFGVSSYQNFFLNLVLALIVIIFIFKNKLASYYGLIKIPQFKDYLYFFPLVLIIAVNFFGGININNSLKEILFYILSMVCIGFLEEIIFRGFLFKMMASDNLKTAILVSSLTFGIGHIVNLVNGSELLPTILQIIYSISLGYLFVMIFIKSKSLWPAIITHILINGLSIFSNFNNRDLIYITIFLVIVSNLYAFYIKKINEND